MSDDQTQDQGQAVNPSAQATALPSAYIADPDELYDTLMEKIEPELLSYNIPYVKEMAEADTPEERKARGERYTQAFAEYERQLAAYQKEWAAQFVTFKHASFSAL